jgi:hypothetical protein
MMELRLRHDPRSQEREQRRRRRSGPATVVSIVLHAILVVVLWNALEVPDIIERFVENGRRNQPVQEHIIYSVLPPSGPATTGQPVRVPPVQPRAAAPSAPPLIAPHEVPSEVPPASEQPSPAQPAAGGTGGNGPLGGGSGPTKGVRPTYEDPRVWVGDPALIYAPKTETERLDSAVAATLGRKVDSLNANTYTPNRFERGDWTVGHGGQKWGIDQKFIHLGRFSLPTALLAMLPFNKMQSNPIEVERERTQAAMHDDIMYHAQAALNEAEFRKAVKAIRERKDRERKEAAEKKKGDPGPDGSPGKPPT